MSTDDVLNNRRKLEDRIYSKVTMKTGKFDCFFVMNCLKIVPLTVTSSQPNAEAKQVSFLTMLYI